MILDKMLLDLVNYLFRGSMNSRSRTSLCMISRLQNTSDAGLKSIFNTHSEGVGGRM